MIFCGFSQLRPIHQSDKKINCLMQLISNFGDKVYNAMMAKAKWHCITHRAPNYESSPIINPSEANNKFKQCLHTET